MKNKLRFLSLTLTIMLLATFITGCTGDEEKEETIKNEEVEDKEGEVAEETDKKDLEEFESDVVVVGGGGTGLVAALKAAEEGSKVVLIEKQGVYGGATAMSSGKIPAFGTKEQKEEGIDDTKEDMLRDIYRAGEYTQNYEILDKAVSESKNVKEWLENFGIKWELETDMIYYGQTDYRIHVAEGGGGEMTRKLVDAVENNDNIVSLKNVEGIDLISNEANEVEGVVAEHNGKQFKLKANSVVLATSGFAANREMVEKYLPSAVDAVINVAPGATGEGIIWAEELGAGVSSMSAYQAYAPISLKTKKSLGAAFLNNGGILLNKNGDRFIDEYVGYSPLGTAIVNQPDNFAYMIWDETIHKLDIPSLEAMEDDELIEAKSIDELAKKLKIDKNKLKEEIDLYNEGIKNKEDYMNRTKLPEKFEAPFYAIKVTGDLRHTQGGLTFNPETAQITTEDMEPIANLYGGGGVIEGFSSSGSANYMAGNGLLQAFVYGKIAGESAALNASKNKVKDFDKTKEELISLIEDNEIKKSEEKIKKEDGKYKGSAEGYGGKLTLEVEVKDGEIVNIDILEHMESEGISDVAINELPEKIIKSNSYDVDVIGGATFTSEGILNAVKDALK